MTTQNQLILTFWHVRPEVDLSEIADMRYLGSVGVYEPKFTAGEKRMLCMVARFDKSDHSARVAAALYAMRNAKLLCESKVPGSSVWGVECWLDGEKLSQNEIPQ